jgi:hypothetical protein
LISALYPGPSSLPSSFSEESPTPHIPEVKYKRLEIEKILAVRQIDDDNEDFDINPYHPTIVNDVDKSRSKSPNSAVSPSPSKTNNLTSFSFFRLPAPTFSLLGSSPESLMYLGLLFFIHLLFRDSVLVKWRFYSHMHSSWIPFEDFAQDRSWKQKLTGFVKRMTEFINNGYFSGFSKEGKKFGRGLLRF